jgi:hypothetical protein
VIFSSHVLAIDALSGSGLDSEWGGQMVSFLAWLDLLVDRISPN